MPTRPPRQCRKQGCPHTVTGATGYCDTHKGEPYRWEQERENSGQRGYDATWQRLRRRYLALHPFCQDCRERGQVVEATLVHHVVPVLEDRTQRLETGNLRALCARCHAAAHGETEPGG